jgi:Na+-translocating ferredoxin:NAD+ oxidoreductase RnfG subunit
MRSKEWNILMAGLAVTAPIAVVSYAETYLTAEQAAQVLFPGVKLKTDWVQLTPQEIRTIEKTSGESVPSTKIRAWLDLKKEALFIDRVIGKHEYITYAVAISLDGKVKGVEIMEYQERYGFEVRDKEWLGQFKGKDKNSPLRVKKDIKNISGATISAFHVTNGVRRVVETYEVLKNRQH